MNADTHRALIETFYDAFQQRDHATMATCYHPEATFSDAVFVGLQGPEVPAMWHMLCERGKDLSITYKDVQATDTSGSAVWDATYTFSATGNTVQNHIEASFVFRDGLIFEHRDSFDLRAWMGMALGFKGKLLGWAPPVQNALRKKARAGLQDFMKKQP